jgi:WD40 repeat protein
MTYDPDGQTDLWEADTGTWVRTLTMVGDPVYKEVIDPSGPDLLAITRSGNAVLWNTDTLTIRATLQGRALDAVYSPDGQLVLVAGDDGLLRQYRVPFESLLALARTRVTREFSLPELAVYLNQVVK